MTYCLNPNLVEVPWTRDEAYPFHDQHVFLRDPKNVGPELFDVTIGKVVLREVSEDNDLANQIADSQARMPKQLNGQPDQKPRVYRTNGCFGYSSDDSVVLVVHSENPVFIDADQPHSPFFEDMERKDWVSMTKYGGDRTLLLKKTTAGLTTFEKAVTSSPNGLMEYPPTGMALTDEGAAQIVAFAGHDIRGEWNRFAVLVYRNGGRIFFKKADSNTFEALVNFPTKKHLPMAV